MKKNLYYRTVLQRRNRFKELIYDIFLAISSYPRLMMEVFLRKNLGERHFKISSVLTAAVLVLLSKKLFLSLYFFLIETPDYSDFNRSTTMLSTMPYILFIVAFLIFSAMRYLEIRRNASAFDFGHFSKNMGVPHPLFFKIKLFGVTPDFRTVETLLEPLVFFIPGLLLFWIGIPIGIFFMLTSIICSISYMAAYAQGDSFVLDHIDEIIMNEQMESSFVEDEDISKTKGVRFYTKKPGSKELRRKLGESFIEDEPEDVAEAV